MPEETAFFMKSSSKQFLAQSLQNIPLCTNTVLHSFSWRCLLVLTFFLPDDTAKHHHSRTVQRFLLQFREVWVIAVRRARKPEAAKGCPQFSECNLYRKIVTKRLIHKNSNQNSQENSSKVTTVLVRFFYENVKNVVWKAFFSNMDLFFDIVVQTYQDFRPLPSWYSYFILISYKIFMWKVNTYTQSPNVTTVGTLSCSSRTDKNELCVLGECILHPTCCIVIKVPPVLYYYYYTSYLASMSFIRSTVFAFWIQILYRRRRRRHRLAASAHRLSGWVWLQCPVLGFTRQKCDPILTGLMLPATLLLLL